MMSTVTVEVTINRFPQLAARFPVATSAIVGKFLFDASAASAPLTPVDKGILRGTRQVRFRRGDQHGSLYWPAHYAAHQNYGTARGVPAKHFAEGAVRAALPGAIAAARSLEGRL